ncbi:OsmC family protein [Luteirhabdus pelagi]|uniref:OsmC family protein n=1 Tax=Luteirhabdus pelagi TaxID=2792783 RepID=UPI0019395895|nr:OsmC family protein [Luteirhabdus pelagi]
MSTSTVIYLGQLRTKCTHTNSGASYITDAPTDNHGKGEAFSPTDTVATGLANCMLTMMGIKAEEKEVSIIGAIATVQKTMASNPRRISKIEIDMELPYVSKKNQKLLEHTARTCPVQFSLHPDIETIVKFNWDQPQTNK